MLHFKNIQEFNKELRPIQTKLNKSVGAKNALTGKPPHLSEHQLQVKIVNYLRVRHIFCYAISNGFYGGKDRVKAARHVNKLKSEGFMVGAPDLVVLLPNAKTVFLEVKVDKNDQQISQVLFQHNVEQLGFDYHLVRSVEEVEKILKL